MNRIFTFFRIIFLNILLLLLLFICLEIGARGYALFVNKGSFFRPDNFISPWISTYDYPPPKQHEDGNYYFRHRNKPTNLAKPADTVRIITVGGSTTANERPYLVNKVDYPIALERMLVDRYQGKGFEVLNAGADAYSTAQSLINIQFRLVEFKPDIVLLMHNVNDSSVNAFQQGTTPDYSNKYLDPVFLNPALQEKTTFIGLLAKSRLLAKIGLIQMLGDLQLNVDNSHDYGLAIFKRNLASIARICKQHDIELVLLSQPSTMEESKYIRKDVFIAYGKAIESVAREEGVMFIDMFSEFGHDKEHFVDQFHYTPEGIERFATILASELDKLITSRSKKDE